MKQILSLLFPFYLLAQTYTFSGSNDTVAQIVTAKILKKVYARADIAIKIVILPPQESLNATNSGQLDGELARIKNISINYPNLVIVPISLVSIEAVAFSKQADLKIKNWKDLKGHKLTIVKGVKFIEKGTKDLKKEYALTFLEAFNKLENDKTELIVIPKKAAIRFMLQKKYHNIKAVSPVLQRVKLYHFVHKKNAHLVPIISPILRDMKDTGEIRYIQSSYLRSLTN